jgi:hypothetical protein
MQDAGCKMQLQGILDYTALGEEIAGDTQPDLDTPREQSVPQVGSKPKGVSPYDALDMPKRPPGKSV